MNGKYWHVHSFDPFPGREGGSFLVPETHDHECSIP
jgi:hypothetical protein